METSGDAIDRAVARNGVRPGSALERDTRAAAFSIIGTARDAGETDRKLDEYLTAQRTNPLYRDSLAAPNRLPQEKKAPIDPLNLSREQFDAIVAGKVQLQGR